MGHWNWSYFLSWDWSFLLADPGGSTAAAEQALAELFEDPDVAFVHARAVEFGCFTFEVRRAQQP